MKKTLLFIALAMVAAHCFAQTLQDVPTLQAYIKANIFTSERTSLLNITASYPNKTTDLQMLVPSQTGHSGQFLTTNGTVTSWATVSGGGSGITSIATTSPLTGGPITTTGTIAINNAAADGSTKGAASFTATDFNSSSGNISLDFLNGQKATSGVSGYLLNTDWSLFNAKQNAITTGTTAQYFRGDLSLATFPTVVSSFTNDAGYITNSVTTLSSLVSIGTITTGTWHGSAIADAYISSASTWNAKQGEITTGTTAQYFRGDLSLATFPTIHNSDGNENTIQVSDGAGGFVGDDNFTWDGINNFFGVRDASGNYILFLDPTDAEYFIGSLASTYATRIHIDASSFNIDNVAASTNLDPFGTSAGNTQSLKFYELAASGVNYTGFKSPDALAGNIIYTLPTADGSANQVLKTSGGGILSWVTPAVGTLTNVSGTSNRITSSGGATPVIDISSSYVGQSSINTLGTITTGVWNGTPITNANLANSATTINGTSISLGSSGTVTAAAGTLTGTTLNSSIVTSSLTSLGTITSGVWQGTLISPTYGATGVNNGSNTLTLGGNVTHSGSFTQTFTATGNTSVTLPTSGTLYGTASASISSSQLATSLSDEVGSASGVIPFYVETKDADLTATATITWTQTGFAPATPTARYSWSQNGNLVTCIMRLDYAVAGSNCTAVTVTLPSDMPTPAAMTGQAASEIFMAISGSIATSPTGTPVASRSWAEYDGSSHLQFKIVAASGAYQKADFAFSYYK